MRLLSVTMVFGLVLGLCAAAFAQQGAGEEPAPPPDAAEAEEPTFNIDFPGGTAEQFATALQQAIGYYVVVSPGLTRDIGQLKLQDPDLTQFLAEVMRQAMLVPLRGYAFVPRQLEGGAEEAKPKEREPAPRELEQIPFVSLKNTKPADVLSKFAEHVHVPVVLQTEPPDDPVDLEVVRVSVDQVFRMIGPLLGAEPRRVYIVAEMNEDTVKQFLDGMTNDELYRRTKEGLARAAQFTPEQRQQFMAMAYNAFRQMPAQRRLAAVTMMSNVIRSTFQRLGQLDPQRQQELRRLGQTVLDDLRQFFTGLDPQGRSELRPIFNAIEESLGEDII